MEAMDQGAKQIDDHQYIRSISVDVMSGFTLVRARSFGTSSPQDDVAF